MTAPINLQVLTDATEALGQATAAFRELIIAPRQRVQLSTQDTAPGDAINEHAQRIRMNTATVFGISVRDIKGKARPSRFTTPRHVAMFLIREQCPSLSLSQIGRMFGGRDHGTVLHACENVKNWMDVDASIRAKVVSLRIIAHSGGDLGFLDGDGI